ncbi:MAG: ferritin-like domain-containing protein [Rufibacter sp.]
MAKNTNEIPKRVAFTDLMNPLNRRNFLRYTGVGLATTAVLLTSCDDDDEDMSNSGAMLTNDDFGILNYAYALEQLEAAFYSKVIQSPYGNMPTTEMNLLKDIRDHEIAHRDFFKAALGGKAIGDLQVDFSTINFSDRNTVLTTARTFEDLGVSAYNGAGNLITNPDYLTLAGKIVSVEARHAAWIRDMISNGSFADAPQVNAQGLDMAMKPSEVLKAADPFITTSITSQLP